jgi:superfamily I DNA and RNA helicase
MPIEFIPTRVGQARAPAIEQLIQRIREQSAALGIEDGIMYYGWPKFTDYDAVRHYVDLAIISAKTGVVLIRVLPFATVRQVSEAADSISQAAAAAVSQLVRSPLLRTRSRQLKVIVSPALFAPGFDGLPIADIEVFNSEPALIKFIRDLDVQQLSEPEFMETRSILEGAKALVRPNRRIVENPAAQKFAVALGTLEDEIASFDQRQRHVALTALGGPERIRGLAGSGKTVILAMKAALAHLDNPSGMILITYYTRSLKGHLTRLITRFHRHFGEGDPDWKRIHIHHGWGRKDLAGVLRETSLRSGITPMPYSAAANAAGSGQDPFDYACRSLLETKRVTPYYDLILIDEGQDFPSGFYELCFHLAKGARDHKQIVWAYDELQNIFDVKVRTPTELFGTDADGQPRISLPRSLPPHAETNDFVLPKCYRNQRDVLVLAHATGFGIYGEPVQMLQDRAHWEDVGYDVEVGRMQPGERTVIRRPDRNSPTRLKSPDGISLVEVKEFKNVHEEVEYCADEFQRFINGGLQPEDLMAIAIDDRAAKSYLSLLSEALAKRKIHSNNIIADRYNEPAFQIEGKCTLTTVYRAKGNEAAVVAVLGCDAVPLGVRSGRNRLFTAFTRTKGWLRISGMAPHFTELRDEILEAVELAPLMEFEMPDPEKIELIQRDLSERDAKIQRARAEMERLKETLGLTEEDLKEVLKVRGRNGRA